MQSRHQFFVILFAAMLLAVACQNPSSNKIFLTSLTATQPEGVNDDPSIQPAHFRRPESGTDQERFEGIRQVLETIETGQSTLRLLEKYKISVSFEPGSGSRFYPHRNEIVVDSKFGHFSAALILIHEVTHARYFHEGLAADVITSGRQTFVQQKIEEEVAAMVTSIEATIELSETGVDVVNLRPSLYYPYRQAYGSAVRAAKYANPGLDETTLQSTGRAAGRAAVLEALLNGQVVTSVTQQSYREYWGSVWDLKQEI